MNNLPLPSINPLLTAKIQPRLMKDTYKKVHIYLFDFNIVLGKGSFSKVYKGINLNTNEEVAVKVVEMTSITTPKLKQLLLQQIDILMKIKNQNLIKCFEVLSSAKNTYIIMELCTYDFGSICDFIQKEQEKEKSSLMEKQNNKFLHIFQIDDDFNKVSHQSTQNTNKNNFTQKNGCQNKGDLLTKSINSISSTKSVQFEQLGGQFNSINSTGFETHQILKQQKFYPFIKQIFQGLQYLQKQNIVHRDLKLSNIFLTASKGCKIGDFGFATIIPLNQFDIKDTCCIGSPLYMSPQSYIQNVYSLKSDIWSFGILIFQMIYGNPPHWNCSTHEILKTQIKKQINLSKFQKLAKISDELKQVLNGCLQVDVRKRLNIRQLKQTNLFKRLFYQPLESNVIVSSRNKQNIDQSSVQILGRPLYKNESIKTEYKVCEYSNSSTIVKVKEDFKGSFGLQNDRFFVVESNKQNKNLQKFLTFKPENGLKNIYQQVMPNNSFTDRASSIDLKGRMRSITPPRIQASSDQKIEANDMIFKSTDLNGNIFKEINQFNNKKQDFSLQKSKHLLEDNSQFSYKNSQGMQKYLKQLKQIRRSQLTSKQKQFKLTNQKPMTFTDLSNIIINPKNKNDQKNKQVQSPTFASTFSGPFFTSVKYSKQDNSNCYSNQSYQQKNEKSDIKRVSSNDQMKNNHSMFEQNTKNQKPLSSYSPRNNPSLSYKGTSNLRCDDKQNIKDQSLLTKNYSTGTFSTGNKKYKLTQELEKYQYKKKMLEKCTSSPKFDTYQNNNYIKQTKDSDKNMKYMTTSSFFSSNQVKSPKNRDSASNIIKQFNTKQQQQKNNNKKRDIFMKTFVGSNNLLAQFSTKLKQPSHIQKKTYWKGSNNKNFTINLGQKGGQKLDLTQAQNSYSTQFNTLRSPSYLYATSAQQQQNQRSQNSMIKKSADFEVISFSSQPFKLLNGQFIIKDACELIHFSRLLHKLSFMTQNNSNSILLLQYGIQILNNLYLKCENFEIKYHYDSSTKNSLQIRQAFKGNESYLNNLIVVNEKQCYAIKKDLIISNKQNSSVCNKTVQLKSIIQSYIKKYIQRKQALIKLFECNVLFENLTNKVKQVKSPSNISLSNQKPALKKRSSLNSQKGFLNFIRLQKALQEIQVEFVNKKQINKSNLGSNSIKSQYQCVNLKTLINMTSIYIEAILKCIQEHSFMKLLDYTKSLIKQNSKLEFDIYKQMKSIQVTNKSMIQKILEGFGNQQKNNQKIDKNNDIDNALTMRNYSMLVGTTQR